MIFEVSDISISQPAAQRRVQARIELGQAVGQTAFKIRVFATLHQEWHKDLSNVVEQTAHRRHPQGRN